MRINKIDRIDQPEPSTGYPGAGRSGTSADDAGMKVRRQVVGDVAYAVRVGQSRPQAGRFSALPAVEVSGPLLLNQVDVPRMKLPWFRPHLRCLDGAAERHRRDRVVVITGTRLDLVSVGVSPPIPKHVVHWHGKATGSWWAMLPGRQGARLVEAASEGQLAAMVDWHLRMASR